MNRMLPRSKPVVPPKKEGNRRSAGWPISDRDVRALAPKGRAHAGR